MLKLISAHQTGWCQHADTHHDFAPGTTGIVGSNGCGKSNFINGVFTSLTGRVTNGTLEENINWNADEAVLKTVFSVNDTRCTVQRTFRAPRGDDGRASVKSTAWLQVGDQPKIKGVKKVTQTIEDLTGLTPKVASDHVFITQDRLMSLLFLPKSERMKSFMTLIPELDAIEPLRAALAAARDAHPEIESSLNIDDIDASIAELDTEVARLKESASTLETGIEADAERIASAKELLQTANEAHSLANKRLALERRLTAADEREQSLIVQQAENDTKSQALQAELDANATAYTSARDELASMKANASVAKTRAAILDERCALLTEIDTRVKPDDGGAPWAELEALDAQYQAAYAKRQEAQGIIDLLSDGKTNCPTCGNPFTDPQTKLRSAQAALEEYGARASALHSRIQQLKDAQATYERDAALFKQWMTSAKQRLVDLNTKISELPAVEAPSAERITHLTQLVEEHERRTRVAQSHERSTAILDKELATARQSAASLREQLGDMPDVTAVDEEDVTRAQAAITAYEDARTELSRVQGALEAKAYHLESVRKQRQDVIDSQSRAKAVRRYRELLEKARGVLHRDNLPSKVIAAKLGRLNAYTNKFLQLFGGPFSVEIQPDMGIIFTMPNGYRSESADRLSGGQRCVLSVAFRFAINELFARDMGLLILDEPTAWMDETNVDYVGALIQQAKDVSKSSGVQTVIITHALQLVPEFDNIIEV